MLAYFLLGALSRPRGGIYGHAPVEKRGNKLRPVLTLGTSCK